MVTLLQPEATHQGEIQAASTGQKQRPVTKTPGRRGLNDQKWVLFRECWGHLPPPDPGPGWLQSFAHASPLGAVLAAGASSSGTGWVGLGIATASALSCCLCGLTQANGFLEKADSPGKREVDCRARQQVGVPPPPLNPSLLRGGLCVLCDALCPLPSPAHCT